ncbi:MAG: hypothetical protein R3195_10145 [Gemmatimonadota bacterium]|nr:hypothetical protein [Gemmatimonadota bacterium]
MRRHVTIGAMLLLLGACEHASNPHGPDQHTPEVAPENADQWSMLLEWLGVDFSEESTRLEDEDEQPVSLLDWLTDVKNAICNLELNDPGDDIARLCDDPGNPDDEDGPPPGPPWN